MTIALKADASGTFGSIIVGGNEVLKILNVVGDYVDDAAAATGGVPIGGVYRTGSILKVRVS
jgi:hypothetical protein